MSKKQILSVIIAALFCLISAGAAFAGDPDRGQVWQYGLDAPKTKADIAAEHYNYNPEALHQLSLEGGNSDILANLNAPKTKADIAAENYQYDPQILANVGSEAWCLGNYTASHKVTN